MRIRNEYKKAGEIEFRSRGENLVAAARIFGIMLPRYRWCSDTELEM